MAQKVRGAYSYLHFNQGSSALAPKFQTPQQSKSPCTLQKWLQRSILCYMYLSMIKKKGKDFNALQLLVPTLPRRQHVDHPKLPP